MRLYRRFARQLSGDRFNMFYVAAFAFLAFVNVVEFIEFGWAWIIGLTIGFGVLVGLAFLLVVGFFVVWITTTCLQDWWQYSDIRRWLRARRRKSDSHTA